MPQTVRPDSTLALLIDPYGFISATCRGLTSDVFQTRLLLRKTICMRGREVAELFSDPSRFVRAGAAPRRVQQTLFGKGGVQGLDAVEHRHRKQMFLSLMSPERIEQLRQTAFEHWHAALSGRAPSEQVTLYPASQEVFCRAVCEWAGIPLTEADASLRTRQLAALFDQAGALGPKHWRSRAARNQTETWISNLVRAVRTGEQQPPEHSALSVIARHRDERGELLRTEVAAVEVLNVLRPTVAVAVYVTFAALALHDHPECRSRIASGDDDYLALFIQEVRRYYPFFPFVSARVREDFEWHGYQFRRNTRALLDLYGTNHDARSWAEPDAFQPERFREWQESPFNFIPQGAGDHLQHHRCPGEWITIALMKDAVRFLTRELTYDVPEQDLTISRTRVPALPRSRFVLCDVRATQG